MRAVIFANGIISNPEEASRLIAADDWIIAANGGTLNCLKLGFSPHALVGDLDSLPHRYQKKLLNQNIHIERHQPDKDQTDLELAFALALKKAADPIYVLGALGDRWDMTLANFLLPASFSQHIERIRIWDPPWEVRFLKPGADHSITGMPGDRLSLVPIIGTARNVTLSGLKFPLFDQTIRFGSTLGISNEFIEPEAKIRFGEGLLACFLYRRKK